MAIPYLKVLSETFSKANKENIKYSFTIADKNINFVLSNSVLASKLLPAFAHLKSSIDSLSDLTVYVWDSTVSGIPLEKPSFERVENEEGINNGYGFNVQYGDITEPRFIYVDSDFPFMCYYDPIKKEAYYWYKNADAIPYYEKGAPMHTLFDWWVETEGMLLTHAGAVGNKKGGVLIVGKGGQGKSTAAISSLWGDDLYYIADDYLILQNKPQPIVYSLYNTGKLNYDHLMEKLPHLIPFLENPKTAKDEKGLFFFHKSHPEKMISTLKLSSAVLPLVHFEKETITQPEKPMRLLIGLASSTIYQSSRGNKEKLNILTSTLSQLPCYTLSAGEDLSDIPKQLKKLIEQHAE